MMKKVSELLNKYFIYAIWMFLFVSLIVNFRSCGVNKENRRLQDEIGELKIAQDSLSNLIDTEVYNKEELDIRMEILGYEISKRMLYDQNSIIRTVIRPDDRMVEYDKKIDELRKKLTK